MITQRDRYTHRVPRKKEVRRKLVLRMTMACIATSLNCLDLCAIPNRCQCILFIASRVLIFSSMGFRQLIEKKNSWHDWSFGSWQLILNQQFLTFFLHCMVFLPLCSSNFLFLLIFGWNNCVFSFLWRFHWKSEKSVFENEKPLLEEFFEKLWNDVQSRPKSNKHIIFSNWNQS